MQTLTLTRIYNPLDRADKDHIQWAYLPDNTLADLLNASGALITDRDTIRYAVSINGVSIPAAQYATTRLLPGQQITVMPVLHGGGGAKDLIRVVGLVMLAIVAPEIGMLAGDLLFSTTTIGLSVAMTTGLTMLAGAFLLNALLPPSAPQTPSGTSIDQSNSYSWSPVNTQQQGVAIPRYYGTCKISGNIISAYRETIEDKQYINVLVSCGEGPLVNLYDFKLNGQDIANYTGVETHTRLGDLTQETIPNFGDTKTEYALSSLVAYGTPVTYTTIGSDFDGLEVEVGFPSGLFYYNDKGKLVEYQVDLRVEISPHGAGTWTALTQQPGVVTVNTPSGGYWSAGSWYTYYTTEWVGFGAESYLATVENVAWEEVAVGSTTYADHSEGAYYSKYASWHWITTPTMQVDTMLDYVTVSAAVSSAKRYTYKTWGLTAGQYDVRVTKLTEDRTDSRYGDDLYLMAVREVLQDDFTYPGTALVGLRGLASESLSGGFNFECKTDGRLCRVYNGSTWSVVETHNRAWICYDILTQPVFNNSLAVVEYQGYDPAYPDLPRFTEWAEYCAALVPDGDGGTEPRLTWNGPFDAAQSMWDAALQVAKIGRAVPYFVGQKITLAIDKPASPVALITVGNLGLDSFEETFLSMENRAGFVEADFINLDKGLERDKLTVINTAAPNAWGSASLPLQGVIKPSEVWRHCMYHLATTQNLIRVVSGTMDTDSISFTLGDVINVQHDVPQWGEGGRLVSATSTTVTLDKTVTIASGNTYVIMIRLLDNTLVERVIATTTPGDYTTLDVLTAFTSIPVAYDVYAFGQTDLAVKPMRVISIDPSGDLQRKITLTDYNDAVWNSDLLQPVLPTPNYSTLGLDAVAGLSVTERLVKRADGTMDDLLVINFTRPTDVSWKHAEIWLHDGAWYLSGTSDGSEYTASADVGVRYIVKVVSVDMMGNKLADNLCPTATYTTLGKAAPPGNVSGLQADITRGQMRIYWAANSDADLYGYALQIGSTWDDPGNLMLVDEYAGTSYLWTPDRTGTISILAKAVDTSGNYSTDATQLNYTISSPGAVTGLLAQVIDNNVTLKWTTASSGSFPLDYYELRRGTDFATATVIGRKYGTFDVVIESAAGTYKYWVVAVDVAGLYGTESGVYASVNQPPDYTLFDEQNLDFSTATLTNAMVENGNLLLPINTTLSFENHFISNPDTSLEPWAAPQDQLDDGYTIYGSPAPSTGSIVQTIDYGATIATANIHMDVTRVEIFGTVTLTPTIETSPDGSAWTDLGDVYEAVGTAFRYVRYTLAAATSNGGFISTSVIGTKLDMKLKTHQGVVSAVSTDSGGTTVYITDDGTSGGDPLFIDVHSITLTPKGTTAAIAIYDFTDAPNPTSFKVLLFNTSGTRISGDVSWTVRGV